MTLRPGLELIASRARLAAEESASSAAAREFERTMAEHEPRISRLVQRLIGWPGGAAAVEDLVQEVFLAAWQHRGSFRGDSRVTTWLTRIAINKARNWQRAQRVRRWLGLGGEEIAAETPRGDPEEGAAVRRAIRELPARDREVIVLRYLEEREIDEIAALLGLRRNAVDARLSRARQRLRAVLATHDGFGATDV